MNTEHEAAAQDAAAEIVSPGVQLAAARQRAGWTVERLAAELGLPLERMRALERDEHDSFGGVVFVRGYLRRAAVLLGIPAADLIAAYEACCNIARPAELMPVLPPGRWPGRGLSGWTGPTVGAMAIIAAIAATWWLTEGGAETGPAAEQAARNKPAGLEFNVPGDPKAVPAERAADPALEPGQRETAQGGAGRAAVDRVADAGAGAGATSEVSAAEILSASPAPAPAPAPTSGAGSSSGSAPASGAATGPAPTVVAASPEATTLPPGTVDLRLEFTEDCWLEVTDALGRRLAYRLYHAGDVARLRGKAPATVFLGNAEGVRLTVDETSIPVRPARRDGTARLTVGGGAG